MNRIEATVELTKAAIESCNNTYPNSEYAESVAEYMEIIYNKLEDLESDKSKQQVKY